MQSGYAKIWKNVWIDWPKKQAEQKPATSVRLSPSTWWSLNIYLAERVLERVRAGTESTVPLEDMIARYSLDD